jgi:hypothetical protein
MRGEGDLPPNPVTIVDLCRFSALAGPLRRLFASLLLGLAASVAAIPAGAAAPVIKGDFAPSDGCAALPGADSFRAALARVVRARDVEQFVALTTYDIRLDFGGGEGHVALRRRLAEEGEELWRELERLLPLGCAARDGTLVIPALFARDLGAVDPFGALIVTGERVALRVAPEPGAPALGLLTWTLVEAVSGTDVDAAYREVRLPECATTGFVARSFLRSPLDYRLLARQVEGNWMIEAFLAGD